MAFYLSSFPKRRGLQWDEFWRGGNSFTDSRGFFTGAGRAHVRGRQSLFVGAHLRALQLGIFAGRRV